MLKISTLRLLSGFVVVLLCSNSGLANAELSNDYEELLNTPITELLKRQDIKVTSVSKKAERLADAAAAIYVITAEDIRRAGITSIPEALRLAPGVHVAKISSNKWAVSTRGFTDQLATKLLVLMDGRSVYTPLFSGVNWDVQDTVIEDIDRIEVIRGPGGTLWGANAVSGVINIITKKASETSGTLITGTYGNEEQGAVTIRKGGSVGDNLHHRFYGKFFNRDQNRTISGYNNHDDWDEGRAGFRVDWDKNTRDAITFQGDIYSGKQSRRLVLPTLTGAFEDTVEADEERTGGNLLARWERQVSSDSKTALQVYFDHIGRDNPTLEQDRYTYDVDFQHTYDINDRNEFIWGVGYRHVVDHLTDSVQIEYDPPSRYDNLYSTFLQNKYAIKPDKLFLTVGSKFEHNNYTGFEYQPNVRLAWLPKPNQTVWGAVSRAVRTPNRSEEDATVVVANLKPGFVTWVGNDGFESEELISYELGYRIQPNKKTSFDIAAHFSDYDNLRTTEGGVAKVFDNKAEGEVYGLELSAEYEVNSKWDLSANYTFTTLDLHSKGSNDTTAESAENNTAKNIANIRSHIQLPYNLELDNTLYYVDNVSGKNTPAYVRVDARLGWTPLQGLDVSLVVQNLLDDAHKEFGNPLHSDVSEVERSVFANVKWRF